MDKGKAPVEVNPKRPTVVPDSAAQTSSTTPFPPQNVRLSCIILDSINQSVEERITATYAMVDDGLYPRDHTILLGTELRRLTGAMMGALIYRHLDRLCQQAEDIQEKEKEWKKLEERFKELEEKRDEREKEYQQKMIELIRKASAWGQKLHCENGELLRQADSHRTTVSSFSIEIEEKKRKREEIEKKVKERKRWEEDLKEEERKKRKPLHDEIA
ncbi:hypothetical protein Dimus_006035 [Dionaea muscipula]